MGNFDQHMIIVSKESILSVSVPDSLLENSKSFFDSLLYF